MKAIFTVLNSPLHGFIWNQYSDQLAVGRALHQYRGGHGFKSRTGLNFFQAFFSLLLKQCSLLRRSLSYLRLYPQFKYNIQIQPSLKAELLLVYFLAPHYNENCNKTPQHWLQKNSSRGSRDQSGKGRSGEVWNLGTAFSQLAIKRMLVSGIFKQLRTFVVVPDVMSKFSKIQNLFFFRGSIS